MNNHGVSMAKKIKRGMKAKGRVTKKGRKRKAKKGRRGGTSDKEKEEVMAKLRALGYM